MKQLKQFIDFELMLLPVVVKFLFALIVMFCFVSGIVTIKSNVVLAIILIFIVPILVRIVLEFFLIQFKQYNVLQDIAKSLDK